MQQVKEALKLNTTKGQIILVAVLTLLGWWLDVLVAGLLLGLGIVMALRARAIAPKQKTE